MAGNLILIASYPKSGNTWTRMVLQTLLSGRTPDVNSIENSYYGVSRRQLFDDLAPAPAADLLPEEIDAYMPAVYAELASSDRSDLPLVKTHELARRNRHGDWIFPPEHVRGACYLLRHPFDVAASWANHMGMSIEDAVASMASEWTLTPQIASLPLALPEPIGSWSSNILSWTGADAPYSVHVMRYEDLLADPRGGFSALARRLSIRATEDQIAAAVESTRFERLQEQERESGFREKPRTSSQFFRAGKSLSWKGVLTAPLQERILEDHAAVMARFGYGPHGEVLSLSRPLL